MDTPIYLIWYNVSFSLTDYSPLLRDNSGSAVLIMVARFCLRADIADKCDFDKLLAMFRWLLVTELIYFS